MYLTPELLAQILAFSRSGTLDPGSIDIKELSQEVKDLISGGDLELGSVDWIELAPEVQDIINASGNSSFDELYNREAGVDRVITFDDKSIIYQIPMTTSNIPNVGMEIKVVANDDNWEEASNAVNIFSTYYHWQEPTENVKRGIFHRIQDGYAYLLIGDGTIDNSLSLSLQDGIKYGSGLDQWFQLGEETFFWSTVEFDSDVVFQANPEFKSKFTLNLDIEEDIFEIIGFEGRVAFTINGEPQMRLGDDTNYMIFTKSGNINTGGTQSDKFIQLNEGLLTLANSLVVAEDTANEGRQVTHIAMDWDNFQVAGYDGAESGQNTFNIGMKKYVGTNPFLDLGSSNKTVIGWRDPSSNKFLGMYSSYDQDVLYLRANGRSIAIGGFFGNEDLYVDHLASEGGIIEGFFTLDGTDAEEATISNYTLDSSCIIAGGLTSLSDTGTSPARLIDIALDKIIVSRQGDTDIQKFAFDFNSSDTLSIWGDRYYSGMISVINYSYNQSHTLASSGIGDGGTFKVQMAREAGEGDMGGTVDFKVSEYLETQDPNWRSMNLFSNNTATRTTYFGSIGWASDSSTEYVKYITYLSGNDVTIRAVQLNPIGGGSHGGELRFIDATYNVTLADLMTTGSTFDASYNAQSGDHIITVDDGNIIYDFGTGATSTYGIHFKGFEGGISTLKYTGEGLEILSSNSLRLISSNETEIRNSTTASYMSITQEGLYIRENSSGGNDGLYIYSVNNGLNIAQNSTQKVSFWGATPVVQPTALTAVDAGVIGATYTATEQAIIANMRTRINELEAKLGSTSGVGLLA